MIHRKSGQIVFVNSVAGKVPIPFRSAFAASKHALQAFSDSLRAEIAMYKLKVLVSSPEYIACDLSNADVARAGTTDEGKSAIHLLIVVVGEQYVIGFFPLLSSNGEVRASVG